MVQYWLNRDPVAVKGCSGNGSNSADAGRPASLSRYKGRNMMDFDRARMIIAIMLTSLCAASFAAPAAIGCGFHDPLEVHLESMYPGSFPVAVALRRAADKGVIDAAALETPGKGTALDRALHPSQLRQQYVDTLHRLQAFRKILAVSAVAAELPASFSLGYVESRLWTRYSRSDGEIRVDIHIDGPARGETVVLTGEPVLTQVLAGKLSVDRALADGLILIDGNESEKSAVRRALIAASMGDRLARSKATTTMTIQPSQEMQK
jgi:hypothetical protein